MEWLTNLSVKWVLVLVGVLLLARTACRPRRRADPSVTATREFLEASTVALVVVFLLVRPFLFQAYFIPSESMRPTLLEGDRLLVNKAFLRFARPERGDLLVFRPPEGRVLEMKDYIKRVVGLPGEVVEVVPERLVVDGLTLMRLTRNSASEIMEQNYRQDAPVGFTFPLRGGAALIKNNVAVITTGLESSIRVVPYAAGDRIQETPRAVYLNGKPLLTVVFGPVEVSRNLTQWGGDPDLQGRVYSINGDLRLVLARGRKLSLDEGHVLVDGKRLPEAYVADGPNYAMPPLKIPAGCYFMMGDNRNHSEDSHAWGPLPAERIIGRAECIFWPPSRARWIH